MLTNRERPKFRTALLDWYDAHHRRLPWRETRDPYAIWVSEVMLQQTRVDTVISYYLRFLKAFANVRQLAAASQQAVLKNWEGLGYYARARNLHKAAQMIVNDHSGRLPVTHPEWMALPGVGPYIAAAVVSIAWDLPFAVVDGNVMRVLARLLRMDAPVNHSGSRRLFQVAADELLERHDPGRFNQAVMELGACVCHAMRPNCPLCPVGSICRARNAGCVDQYPKRLPRAKAPLEHRAVGVLFKNDRILIVQRPLSGLLGGLWEFPNGVIEKGEKGPDACHRQMIQQVGLDVLVDPKPIAELRHAYTHLRLELSAFRCRYLRGRVRRRGPVAHRWVRWNQLDRFPIPKAHLKLIGMLQQARPFSIGGA